jgi:hypothetical protein
MENGWCRLYILSLQVQRPAYMTFNSQLETAPLYWDTKLYLRNMNTLKTTLTFLLHNFESDQ